LEGTPGLEKEGGRFENTAEAGADNQFSGQEEPAGIAGVLDGTGGERLTSIL
jgi:hypothetical protein